MQEIKYFYNGIPLSKYCKDNNINIDTIRTRIWKKKNNKKYQNYSEQDIIDMVVESYGTAVKYMYKGMTLREYCLKNDLNIGTINSRIAKLKEQYKDKTNDELVTLAIENFENNNYRFFYKGIPLIEYCKENPEINYNTIRMYINREKEKNPSLTDEEIIKNYILKEHKGAYKYYYLGIPLKKYCEENNINYKNIIAYIARYKEKIQNKKLTDDEFIEEIMEKYEPFEVKYLYNGMSLRKYCSISNISYYSVISYLKRKIKKEDNKSIEELIDEAIKTINRYGIIYYYNGIPLKDYAEENNLNASSIRCSILRKQLRSNKPLQEIVNECVETYQKFSIKYYYHNIPLTTFCKQINLNYNTVIQKYLDEYGNNSEISIDEAITKIVDYYIENKPVRTKYYFKNQSLSKFCNNNSYSYLSLLRKIKNLESKNESLTSEEIILEAIKKYEEKLEINKTIKIFQKIKIINKNEEIEKICKLLKIDYDNLNDLLNMDFSINQAINIIWNFSDNKNEEGYKIITDKKIKEIFSLISDLKDNKIEIEKVELYDLIGIYKSELYDSRSEILQKENKYINKVLYSLCSNYDIKVNKNNYEDFESEIKYYILKILERICLNNYGQIIRYIDLSVKGYFRKYLKEFKKQNTILSLDAEAYLSDKENKKAKKRIDIISNSSNQYEQLENTSFSEEMMLLLSSLNKEDLNFIMLKYQENYSDEELAEYFNLTIIELKEKENKLLSLLKRNDNIKKLIKNNI